VSLANYDLSGRINEVCGALTSVTAPEGCKTHVEKTGRPVQVQPQAGIPTLGGQLPRVFLSSVAKRACLSRWAVATPFPTRGVVVLLRAIGEGSGPGQLGRGRFLYR